MGPPAGVSLSLEKGGDSDTRMNLEDIGLSETCQSRKDNSQLTPLVCVTRTVKLRQKMGWPVPGAGELMSDGARV